MVTFTEKAGHVPSFLADEISWKKLEFPENRQERINLLFSSNYYGNVEQFKHLLKKDPSLITAKSEKGLSLMEHLTSSEQRLEWCR